MERDADPRAEENMIEGPARSPKGLRLLTAIASMSTFGATPPLMCEATGAGTKGFGRSAMAAQRSTPDLRHRQVSAPRWALVGAEGAGS